MKAGSRLTKNRILFTLIGREYSFPFSSKNITSILTSDFSCCSYPIFIFRQEKSQDVLQTCLSPVPSHFLKEAFMNKNVTVNSEIPQTGSETAAALSSEWESLTITSRFIFAKIFQQEDICLTLLQRLFPELDITEVKYVEAEKTVEGSIGSKAVRFDVYVKTPKKYAFTLEMQVEKRDSLPKRSRYYSAMMCEDLLALGASYGSLPPAYVVMFCPFDLFRKGRHIYTFTYKCSEDPSVSLEDGSCVMFLNSKGTADDVSPEILSFLNGVSQDMG